MAINKKKILLAALAAVSIAAAFALAGCASTRPDPVTKQSYYFDTVCQITIYDMKDMSSERAADAIQTAFDECADWENLLSKTKEGSDVWKINHAGGKPVKCDPATVKLIKKGIHYGDLSGGLFDITIGKAEDLYNFHEEEKHTVPTEAQLADAVKYVNYKQIKIDGNRVSMGTPKGEIDLGGIGKGYIADQVGSRLKKEGVTSAIISLGGNIVVIGDKYGEDFRIGIEKPFSDMSKIIGTSDQKNATLVTSGIYERYFKKNGKLYHHILDPATGKPADTDISGVTIVSKLGRSGDCDSLATTCLLMGVEKGTKFINSLDGYEALFISRDGKITKTKGMKFTEGEDG